MSTKSGSIDYWRKFFGSAKSSDMFEVIENAIMVAASDYPKEFKLRMDGIAETLFSCGLTKCLELAVPKEKGGLNGGGGEFEGGISNTNDDAETNLNPVSNYSYDEAEALTEEIEEQTQIVGEVLRIKEILSNSEDQSEEGLFKSLRKPQLMVLSMDILKATEVGKAVNRLRKHGSKGILHLARTLISEWKEMVDEWLKSAPAITDSSADSVNPAVVNEEECLPSPPMDCPFFATYITSIELCQFFDSMSDDGMHEIPVEETAVTKRKVHEGYQKAKKRQTIRVNELRRFPKKELRRG